MDNTVKINCVTDKGGSVTLNEKHGVMCSYAVAGVSGDNPSELLYTWIKLPNGRQVQLFVNRETEILRINANEVKV